MFDATQLAEIEKQMNEEHRLDRLALERLKRFMPSARKETGLQFSAAIEQTAERFLNPTNTRPLIESVADVLRQNKERAFTSGMVFANLTASGFTFANGHTQALGTIATALGKLSERGAITLIKKGAGRTPNVYQWREEKEATEAASHSIQPTL